MTRRITDMVPTPRRCPLAGQDYEVWPATLRDVARLQAWLDSGWNDPLDAVWGRLHEATDDERRTLLLDAETVAEVGSPLWDEDAGRDRLATIPGACAFLEAMLRRGHPGITIDEVVTIVVGKNEPRREPMTPSEYARARRAFFGVDSHREIQRLMLGPVPEGPHGQRLTWGQLVHEVAAETGWTYAQVYDMTLGEFANARRHGNPPEAIEYPIAGGESPSDAWRKVCMRVYGKPPEDLFPEVVIEPSVDAW